MLKISLSLAVGLVLMSAIPAAAQPTQSARPERSAADMIRERQHLPKYRPNAAKAQKADDATSHAAQVSAQDPGEVGVNARSTKRAERTPGDMMRERQQLPKVR